MESFDYLLEPREEHALNEVYKILESKIIPAFDTFEKAGFPLHAAKSVMDAFLEMPELAPFKSYFESDYDPELTGEYIAGKGFAKKKKNYTWEVPAESFESVIQKIGMKDFDKLTFRERSYADKNLLQVEFTEDFADASNSMSARDLAVSGASLPDTL